MRAKSYEFFRPYATSSIGKRCARDEDGSYDYDNTIEIVKALRHQSVTIVTIK